MVRAALFAAFPHEIKRVVRNLGELQVLRTHPFSLFLGTYSSRKVIVVLTGMGATHVTESLQYVLKEYKPDLVLSGGFGGALYEGAVPGEIVSGSKAALMHDGIEEILHIPVAADILSVLPTGVPGRRGDIVTLGRWTKKSEIRSLLGTEFSFPVCDMETYFLARLCIREEVPFAAFRSITDRADEEIPSEFLSVTDEMGRYKLSRALRLFLKPHLMKDIVKIGRNANTAAANVWHTMRSLIERL